MGRKTATPRDGFRVGSQVTYRIGDTVFNAEVVEDRGFIGRNGRHLLRIRTFDEMEEVRRTFEVPAEELTLVQPWREGKPLIR